ncbi:hypothetical protein A3Q56_01589 [Intoshia linei]|uniref:Uncharacterized protein n=1 Tax=Intoshia linei TaxID=1819745 RepID=A0A177BAI3_9BILA|nr:hypothetical protein A3Q56_01589 [Intoshia linei]
MNMKSKARCLVGNWVEEMNVEDIDKEFVSTKKQASHEYILGNEAKINYESITKNSFGLIDKEIIINSPRMNMLEKEYIHRAMYDLHI